MSEVTILHINDMHSNFHSIKTQTRFMKERRAQLEKEGQKVFGIDLGDLIDRVHPLVEAEDGKIASRVLNEEQIDFATLGNNEGTAYTPLELEAAYEGRKFEVIISNVKWASTGQVPPFAKEVHFEKVDDCSIAFIGLTASYPESYGPNGYLIEEPMDALKRLVPTLAASGHQIILLSHLGIEMDHLIAKTYPEIQVILGAHTHHLFEEGKWVNQTLLTGGFKYGAYIGELHLRIEGSRLIPLSDKMIAVEDLKENSTIDEGEALRQEGITLLKEEVVLPHIPAYSVKQLALLSLEAMTRQTGVTVAFTYTGLFVGPFKEGPLTKFDLHECMPHPIHLNKSRFRVSDFKQLLQIFEAKQPELLEKAIRGYGFRGKLFGEILCTGFQLASGEVVMDGRTLADDEFITFVCPDHMRFVPFFPMIEEKGDNEIIYPDLLRTIIEKELVFKERKNHD